ncbi:MAG: ABC transporter ATP-binding protein [Sideroxydans sp.]|nr:ABC transporter ATP-binding protein [Sideroxydans sp.]
MILASFAEILSIGAVLPFLGALTAPNRIFEHPAAQPFIQALGLTSADQLLLPLTITFGLAALMAGALRVGLLWTSLRLSFAVGADLSNGIYRRTLYQPYVVHIARNSSEVINGISTKVGEVIFYILMPTLNLISAVVMLVAILVALLTIIPGVALAAFAGFGLVYAFIIRLARNRLKIDSQHIARESTNVIKSLQEGLGGIRDVLIDGSQEVFCTNYRKADHILRRSQGRNQFISYSPRYGMEALAMLLIASLAYVLSKQPDGIAMAIPMLAAMALGMQRLLPALQQAYGAWSIIHGAQASLQDALVLLDQPLPNYAEQPVAKPLPFQNQISLNRVSFRYSTQTPWVLKNIDLTIAKGSRVGFIGTTGSGKSTLLDIIMGLLQPTEGVIEIDGQSITVVDQRSWQTHIAHVPQAIFLADSNIEENIAFGVPKDQIDHERVRKAARQAQIADIIETWPRQYQTNVGERGVQLSGGQRQRIGIARALYKQADVIIFDESTSALDNETELAVMQAIDALGDDLTILIIAHRLSTLKNCTQIIEIASGSIQKINNLTDE